MAIIDTAEFIGKFEIHVNGADSVKLATYIERYENSYLIDMLGVELAELFIADLSNPVQEPRFVTIYEPLNYQDECNQIYKSRGVKDMLLGFIYFEYQRDKKVQQTINGAVKVRGTNSQIPRNIDTNIIGRYNESVASYRAIQQYIVENGTEYPEFKGIHKDLSWLQW